MVTLYYSSEKYFVKTVLIVLLDKISWVIWFYEDVSNFKKIVELKSNSNVENLEIYWRTFFCQINQQLISRNFYGAGQNEILSSYSVWKNVKFSHQFFFFREIGSLVISFVKVLLSRNFCQKCVLLNSRNFHNVR